MLVFPVSLRFVVVTDSEFWAAMEAAETQCATLCRPNGVLAEFVGLGLFSFLHVDSLHRTFLGAQPATETSIFIYCKELGMTLVCQQRIGYHAEEIRHSVMAFVALYACLKHRNHFGYLRLGDIHLLLHFLRVAQVEHRSPVVRHLDGVTGIHGDALALQFTACVLAYKPLQETVGGNTENIVVLRQADVGFADEFAHQNRQFVPVGGGHKPQRFAVCETDFSTCDLDGLRLCAECFGDTGCHMLAVARGGEIVYQVLIVWFYAFSNTFRKKSMAYCSTSLRWAVMV